MCGVIGVIEKTINLSAVVAISSIMVWRDRRGFVGSVERRNLAITAIKSQAYY